MSDFERCPGSFELPVAGSTRGVRLHDLSTSVMVGACPRCGWLTGVQDGRIGYHVTDRVPVFKIGALDKID